MKYNDFQNLDRVQKQMYIEAYKKQWSATRNS